MGLCNSQSTTTIIGSSRGSVKNSQRRRWRRALFLVRLTVALNSCMDGVETEALWHFGRRCQLLYSSNKGFAWNTIITLELSGRQLEDIDSLFTNGVFVLHLQYYCTTVTRMLYGCLRWPGRRLEPHWQFNVAWKLNENDSTEITSAEIERPSNDIVERPLTQPLQPDTTAFLSATCACGCCYYSTECHRLFWPAPSSHSLRPLPPEPLQLPRRRLHDCDTDKTRDIRAIRVEESLTAVDFDSPS